MPKASAVKIIKADGSIVIQPSYKTAKAAKQAVYKHKQPLGGTPLPER